MALGVMPAWMGLPLMHELLPIRDAHTIIRKISTAILSLGPVSRFPECAKYFYQAGFIHAVCGQFDDASLYLDIFEVVI
jgi:hypothetical protein